MRIATTSTLLILLLLLFPSFLGGCYGYPRYRTVMALSQPSTASSLSQLFLLRKEHRTESTTAPVVLVPAATTSVACQTNQYCRRRNLRDDPSDDDKDDHRHQDDAVVTPSSSATTPTTTTRSNNHSGSIVPSETWPSSAFLSNTENTAATTERTNQGHGLLVGIGVAAIVVLIALLLLRSDKVRMHCCCRHTTKQYHNNRLAHHHPKHTSSSLKDGPPSSNNNHESTTSREEEDMNCNSSFSSHDDSPPPSGRSVVVPVLLDDPSTWYDQSLVTMEGFTITGESDAGKTTAPLEGFSIRSGFTIPSETGGGAGGGGGIIISTTARPAQRNTGSMDDDISLADDIVSCLDSSLAMTDPDPTFVVVTRTVSLPPSRRLGIQIGDTVNGPTIMSVRHDSPCADYLFEGDVIIQLGDVIMTRRPNDDCTNRNGSHNEKVMKLFSATEIAHWLDERCHEPRRTIMVQSRLEQ